MFNAWKLPAVNIASIALVAGLTLESVTAGAAADKKKTITAVMHSDLRLIDPYSPGYITRDHGYMVYDTLLSTDSNFKITPQMADWKVSDDKLTYTFTLRPGLKWHDGQPVTAEDCVASLKRWAKKDIMGQKLMEFTSELYATDDKTITLKLKEFYNSVLETIGKPSVVVPYMLPKRLAETPPEKTVSEQIGSGPFKFVQQEFRPGVKVVYEKFADYVPRAEPPNWTSGGKVAKVDRVEWITMPDRQTAVNALMTGDIDFIEDPPYDLLPLLQSDKDIEIKVLSSMGWQAWSRMNFLNPPFDNVKVRRAAMLAFNQKDFLDAITGNPEYYRTCGAVMGCGGPFESDIASDPVVNFKSSDAARKALAESGYDGTPVVIMFPTDIARLKALAIVGAQHLRNAGFNVEMLATDWQTSITRRSIQKPPKEGGWSMFFSVWAAPDVLHPIANSTLNSKGTSGGWFGWPKDDEMEKLRDDFVRAGSHDDQLKVAKQIQAHVFDYVTYVPLGQVKAPSAWRKNLRGVLPGPATPVFWNIEKLD